MFSNDNYLKGYFAGLATMFGLIAAGVLVFLLFFYEGRSYTYPVLSSDAGSEEEFRQSYDEFWTKQKAIMEVVDSRYYKSIDLESMYDGALKGMMASLNDPYSCYYSAKEMQTVTQTNSGSYVGIGCSVGTVKGSKDIIVFGVVADSPAERGGLKAGDIIVAIDGKDITGLATNYALTLLQGKEGIEVTLTIKRGNEKMDLSMVRARIEQKSISKEMFDDGIGYIRLYSFYQNTPEQMRKAIEELNEQGMKKLIIDLRDNPGGLYDMAVEMLDMMLPKDLLVSYTEDKSGKREESYTKDDDTFDKPVVILINDHSASASELFTQTMRDYEKATIIGITSYGKGIFQELIPIKTDGSGIRITGGRYYSGKGVCIHEIGIEPDITVELEETEAGNDSNGTIKDNQIQAAIDYLKKN